MNLAPHSFGETSIAKDKFVFKISGEVFTLKEVQEYYQSAKTLHCIFKDSLLTRVFDEQLKEGTSTTFLIKKNYSAHQKVFFESMLSFGKALVYIRSYSIKIKPSILKYFHLMANKNSCDLAVYRFDKTPTAKFKEILELETFLRTRFLPTEIQGKTTPEDMRKAVISAKNLLNSISEQLDQEVYW